MPTVKEIVEEFEALVACGVCGSTTSEHDTAAHNRADDSWLGATPPTLNLVQKLAKIRRELKRIEKKGENSHFHYTYMRAEDVAGDIGDKLAEHNIVLSREDGKSTVLLLPDGRGYFVLVESVYVFMDGDSGEQMRVWSCGAGTDSQDKAPYKAQTGALKYALTQALCMRVGDDPEEESGARAPKERLVLDNPKPVEDDEIDF